MTATEARDHGYETLHGATPPNRSLHPMSEGEAPRGREFATSAGPSLPFGSYVRIGFGVIWLIDAVMKWVPAFHFMDVVKHGADSQPGWLGPWYRFWEGALGTHPSAFALATATVETVIALALLLGFARMSVYLLGVLWSLGIWAVPEGLGNDDRMMSTDIGTGIIYVFVFLALLALDQCYGTRPWSLDVVIERRRGWWRRIAEIRK
jgi:uncharacterized membrane protein YphA (DoxX/SURF4 family)